MKSRLSLLSPRALTVGAVSFTVFAWASAFVSIRSAGAAYSPGALALGRLLAASLVLVALLLVRREGLPPRGAWRGIVISGLVWFCGYTVALNWGERLVDAGTASLLVNTGPILMALLAARLLGEALPPRLLAGMAVSFVGAVVVGLSMSSGGDGSTSALGVALCLLAAVAYATGVVAQKPALSFGTPMQITAYSCLTGAVASLPFAGQLAAELPRAPVSATLNMVYLGVVPTALAFIAWSYALARMPAGKLGSTTYAVPAVVVLLSWVLLGEVPAWLTLIGGVLCLTGVAVSRRRPRSATAVAAAVTN
ncbi:MULTISPECIES: DMT family transporter [unclassified Streptomyces]|uniref:DMT family transporter n=1 Tax=unclassified Streptomyces TaxID=2593676 RepID=UPI001BEA13C9|nr:MULTISPECIES: DMT family transporter [unclassified Streptomyces]MBT2406511.1 DMT family transporter [Streptomyces sp. ISL-21]MBT2459841.1 DMT family transporter [Streptomyces sp. ISL-86]MBT2608849.1 DMT family transporter [Streptomyces sp. ISL-87]